MNPVPSLADVRGASVRVGENAVGSVVDVFTDATGERVVGLELVGPDGRRWFLPWAAATLSAGEILASSSLVLIAAEQLGFYADHGLRLLPQDLPGLAVDEEGRLVRPSAPSARAF